MLYMQDWIVLGLMAGIGGVLDIVKIRKTGSKTGQKRFRIFMLTFLNSLGQDGSNETVPMVPHFMLYRQFWPQISTSTFDLKNLEKFFGKKIILKS